MKKYIIIIIFVIVFLVLVSNKSQADSVVISNFKTSQATVNKVNTYQTIVQSASQIHGVPEKRIKAHIAVESEGDPNAPGKDGEVGLMQMLPKALQAANNRFSPNAPLKLIDLYQPNYSIASGTAYLHILLDQLGSLDKASMAYNVGAKNIDSTNAKIYLNKILMYEKLF